MSWFYNGQVFDKPSENNFGFVYLITNKVSGKMYVGKKLFWHKKIKTIKGKRKRYLAESDWMSYYGSSKQLQEDLKSLGEDNFNRTILHLCDSKGQCSYLEAKEQFDRNVLFNSDLYYNDWIIVRVHRKHIIERVQRQTL